MCGRNRRRDSHWACSKLPPPETKADPDHETHDDYRLTCKFLGRYPQCISRTPALVTAPHGASSTRPRRFFFRSSRLSTEIRRRWRLNYSLQHLCTAQMPLQRNLSINHMSFLLHAHSHSAFHQTNLAESILLVSLEASPSRFGLRRSPKSTCSVTSRHHDGSP
jgi:hypothetical protein